MLGEDVADDRLGLAGRVLAAPACNSSPRSSSLEASRTVVGHAAEFQAPRARVEPDLRLAEYSSVFAEGHVPEIFRIGRVNRDAGSVGLLRGSGTWRGGWGATWDPVRASVSACWASIGMASR